MRRLVRAMLGDRFRPLGAGMDGDDGGASIFPTFDVNVPMPEGTAVPPIMAAPVTRPTPPAASNGVAGASTGDSGPATRPDV